MSSSAYTTRRPGTACGTTVGGATGAGSVTSSQEPALTLCEFGPGGAVDQRVAGVDERRGGGAGQPEQPRHGLVQAHPVEAVRHGQGTVVAASGERGGHARSRWSALWVAPASAGAPSRPARWPSR